MSVIGPRNCLTIFVVLIQILEWRKLTGAVTSIASCTKNDDYCDCGNDELQSSACSFYSSGRLFQCRDDRYFKQNLFLSRVGDGVCDCCDGSDEIHGNTPVLCPNICDIIGSNFDAQLKLLGNSRVQGIGERATILSAARAELKELRIGLRKAQMLIPEHRKLISDYKNQLVGESSIETMEFKSIHLSSESFFRQSLLNFSAQNLQRLLAVITLLTGGDGVESILVDCDGKHEYNGSDPDDIKAFTLASGDTCPVDGKGELSTYTVIRAEEISISTVQSMIDALSLARLSTESLITVFQHAIPRALEKNLSLIDCFQLANVTVPSPTHIESILQSPACLLKSNHKRPEAEVLRAQIEGLNSEISVLIDGAKKAKSVANSSYGPDNSLFTLRDQCLSYKQREHDYEICVFKDVRQGRVLVGKFDKIEVKAESLLSLERADGILTDIQSDREAMFITYINGDICYGTQKPRNMVIKLECGCGDARISEVDEVEICSYRATLVTPLACTS